MKKKPERRSHDPPLQWALELVEGSGECEEQGRIYKEAAEQWRRTGTGLANSLLGPWFFVCPVDAWAVS